MVLPAANPAPVPMPAIQVQPPAPEPDTGTLMIRIKEPPERTTLDMILASGVPVLTIGESPVPMFGSSEFDTWALLNLALCLFGAISAVFAPILMISRRRYEKKIINKIVHEEKGNTKIRRLREDAHEDAGGERKAPQMRLVWLTVAMMIAVVGVFMFMFTQDMSWTMVLTDIWTINHLILIAAEIVAIVLVFKRTAPAKAFQN